MDRRRFSPTAEGLEGRALMSFFGGGNTLKQNTTISFEDLPKTYKQKELRIAHLPYYLQQEDPQRYLPTEAIQDLQNNLNLVVGGLIPPNPNSVNAFNADLRHLMVQNNLSQVNAQIINYAFGSVLVHAGTPTAVVNSITADMNELAKADAQSIQPTALARQDYSLVLQTTLAVGRPLPTPTAPSLEASDGRKIAGGKIGLTHDVLPTLVGTYQGGATRTGVVWMQIVNYQTGAVYASAPIDSAGRYTAKITTPLPDGKYLLVSRSVDEAGHLSYISHPFTLFVKRIVPKDPTASTTEMAEAMVPAGPLGLQ